MKTYQEHLDALSQLKDGESVEIYEGFDEAVKAYKLHGMYVVFTLGPCNTDYVYGGTYRHPEYAAKDIVSWT